MPDSTLADPKNYLLLPIDTQLDIEVLSP